MVYLIKYALKVQFSKWDYSRQIHNDKMGRENLSSKFSKIIIIRSHKRKLNLIVMQNYQIMFWLAGSLGILMNYLSKLLIIMVVLAKFWIIFRKKRKKIVFYKNFLFYKNLKNQIFYFVFIFLKKVRGGNLSSKFGFFLRTNSSILLVLIDHCTALNTT